MLSYGGICYKAQVMVMTSLQILYISLFVLFVLIAFSFVLLRNIFYLLCYVYA